MTPRIRYFFEGFCLDPAEQLLAEGSRPLKLTPRALSLLHYFLLHPGRLISKEELLGRVWSEAVVGDGALKVCIREIRKVLVDDAKVSQYIETVHRRGYRFLPDVRTESVRQGQRTQGPGDGGVGNLGVRTRGSETSEALPPAAPLVMRDALLRRLDEVWRDALEGRRQIVFLSGEIGAGKTAAIESWARGIENLAEVRVAKGQCFEQFGAGEAYLPILSALTQLCRGGEDRELTGLLRRYAPTWLVHMPSVIDPEERELLLRETLGATRERMLREMAEALEAVAAKTPLLFVIEDLHWSDYSTLDLVSLLARRVEPASLMLVGTYRPVELNVSQHPLRQVKQELQSRGQCCEVPVELFDEQAVAEVLGSRLPHLGENRDIVAALHRRTGGNPLFLRNVIDYLADRGDGESAGLGDVQSGVPDTIRGLIEVQVDRLEPEEKERLEAASVAGIEFSALAVAAALDEEPVGVEEGCEKLHRRYHFLRPLKVQELPDGSVATRFGFEHSLYQSVVYDRISPARRVRFHRRIADRGEAIYGDRVGEIAAELAGHFEEGRDNLRASRYRLLAAEVDSRRFANREAIGHLESAIALAESGPRNEVWIERWIETLRQLGLVRRSMGDMKGAAQTFQAMVRLASDHDRLSERIQGLLYLVSVLFWMGRDRCLDTSDEAVRLSERLEDRLLRAHTRGYCSHWNLNLRGYSKADAEACAGAIEAAREAGDRSMLSLHLTRYAYAQCQSSDYANAWRTAEEAIRLATEVGDAYDYLLGQFFRSWALLHGGRWGEFLTVVRNGSEMAEKNGHHLWSLLFRVLLAHLHEEAGDYALAAELCAPALARAEQDLQGTGQLYFHSLIVLGLTAVGQGDWTAAAGYFQRVHRGIEGTGGCIDWLLYFPLHFGQAELAIRTRDWEEAAEQAGVLAAYAERAGEKSYLLLARKLELDVASQSGQAGKVADARARVEELLGEESTPLAGWRACQSLVESARVQGDLSRVAEFQRQREEIFLGLGESLAEAPDLRERFLERVGELSRGESPKEERS